VRECICMRVRVCVCVCVCVCAGLKSGQDTFVGLYSKNRPEWIVAEHGALVCVRECVCVCGCVCVSASVCVCECA